MTLTIQRVTLDRLAGQDLDDALLELWLEGLTPRQIAKRDDVTVSHVTVWKRVNRALKRRTEAHDPDVEQARTAARDRTNKLLAVAFGLIHDAENGADIVRGIREARRLTELRARIDGVLATAATDTGEQISVAEVQGEALVQVLILVLGSSELGLDVEKQDIARALAGRHLRALTS